MVLSAAAWSGSEAATTLRLRGQIQQHDLLILIDSGSSQSFISDRLQSVLSGVQPLEPALSIRVANGQTLSCCY